MHIMCIDLNAGYQVRKFLFKKFYSGYKKRIAII